MVDISLIPYTERAGTRPGTRPSVPEGPNDVFWNPATNTLSLPDETATAWVDYVLSTAPTATNLADLANVASAPVAKGGLLIPDGTAWQTLAAPSNNRALVSDSSQSLGWTFKDYKLIGLVDWNGTPANGDVPMYNTANQKWEPSAAITAATAAIGVSFYSARDAFFVPGNASSLVLSFTAGQIKLNTNTMWAAGNPNRFTVPSAGKYHITLNVTAVPNAPESVSVSDPKVVVQNQIGTTLATAYFDQSSDFYTKFVNLDAIVDLSATNYLTFTVSRPSGYAAYLSVNGSIHRIGS